MGDIYNPDGTMIDESRGFASKNDDVKFLEKINK